MAKTNAISDLIGIATSKTDKADGYILVDINTQLVNRSDNREIDQSAVDALVDSIKKDGLAQPILARTIPGNTDKYELIAGQHRCEAYKKLQEEDPTNARWRKIECKIVKGMDDETAWRLMYATNVIDANRSQAERGRMLLALYGEQAQEIKREHGGRIRDIVSDLYNKETGKTIPASTVERAIGAAKAEKSDEIIHNESLINEWNDVINSSDKTIPAGVKSALTSLNKTQQKVVYRDWRESGSNNRWLREELDLRTGNQERLLRQAQKNIIDGCGLLARCQRASKNRETEAQIDQAIADCLAQIKSFIDRS